MAISPPHLICASSPSEGAVFDQMFAEEHYSQGNYFWLFSGSNHNVGFFDQVPSKANHADYPFTASNLGEQLIKKGLTFKGYSESLPEIGYAGVIGPENCDKVDCLYARKHVPWISFANVPNGSTVETSSNLRFADFPTDFDKLPTVAFVIPNLINDMHNGAPAQSIPTGDSWLKQHLDAYYQWAKSHNSLLIVTFDENDDTFGYAGLTTPFANPGTTYPPAESAGSASARSAQSRGDHLRRRARPPRHIPGRARHHPREHPAHHRGDVRPAEIRRAATQCRRTWYHRREDHHRRVRARALKAFSTF